MFIVSIIKKLIPENFFLRILWHRLVGFVAAWVYGFPAKELHIIGVTGTDGKSSTVEFLASILEQNGLKVGMASTIRFQIGDKKWINRTHKTTLGRFDLQRLLKKMKKENCDVVVLEVSSHALYQGRLIGVPFMSGVITNLSSEHLDFHKTMDKYSKAKELLFKKVVRNNYKKKIGTALVVNIDDKYKNNFLKYHAMQNIAYSYNKKTNSSDNYLYASDIELSFQYTKFVLHINSIQINIKLNILGDFNIYNALAASGAGLSVLGEITPKTLKIIKTGLEKIEMVPGRMELVDTKDKIADKNKIKCMIDFGLTEKAMTTLYKALRKIIKKGRIISVFGACGNRDKQKRPIIGKLAKELTDIVIICNDETYGEPFDKIREEILSGVIAKSDLENKDRKDSLDKTGIYKYDDSIYEIPNRELAIHYAIKNAKQDDLVIITGMGDFDTRMLVDGAIPWNEREIIRQALRKL